MANDTKVKEVDPPSLFHKGFKQFTNNLFFLVWFLQKLWYQKYQNLTLNNFADNTHGQLYYFLFINTEQSFD